MLSLDPTRWVDLYADDLFRLAMYRLNDASICEDLVQETFLSALKARNEFKGESSEKTWLTAILKHKIADVFRRKKQQEILIQTEWEHILFENDPYDTHWKKNEVPTNWDGNAEEKLIGREYIQVLRNCISRLSGIQQSLLQNKFFEEKKGDAICKEMNLTPSNYWVMMHRINLQLRKCLEQNWFGL